MNRQTESVFDAPAVGEIWRSLDPRDVKANRRVIVERLTEEFAFVESKLNGRNGRRSRIHRSRFDGREFELVGRV